MERPKYIEFEAYIIRIGVRHHIVEKCSIVVRLELVTMVVITKRETIRFLQYFSCGVKIFDSFFCSFNSKRTIMRNPRDANERSAEGFCVLRYLTCFVHKVRVANTEGSAAHASFIQHLSQFSGCLSKKIGKFDVCDTKSFDGIERRRYILLKTVTIRIGNNARGIL